MSPGEAAEAELRDVQASVHDEPLFAPVAPLSTYLVAASAGMAKAAKTRAATNRQAREPVSFRTRCVVN